MASNAQISVLVFTLVSAASLGPTAIASPLSVSEHLEDTVRMLKGQVQALLEQKEQESQLAQELKSLREDVTTLKLGSKRGHNTEMRLSWLESSVSETRSQLGDLNTAVVKDRPLQNSVAQLRGLIDQQAAEIRALRANMQTLHAQILAARQEMEDHTPHRKEGVHSNTVSESKRTRHHRGLRGEVEEMKENQMRLTSEVSSLSRRLRAAEEISNSSSERMKAPVLELLETVQGLETKLDSAIPSLQKEISRTELSLAQVMQQSALMKENQENHRATLKALSAGMSTMQDKMSVKQLTMKPSTPEAKDGNSTFKVILSNLTKVVSEYEEIISHLPHDCSGLSEKSKGEGLIRPGGEGQPLIVDCDEGWTVIQRRCDGSQEFNKNWEEYAKGFGSPSGEFWIGNEALHRLTKSNTTSLRVDLVDIYGGSWYAEYSMFRVGPREDGFRLNVGGYHGNASDALDYQNGMEFSAVDSDRDSSNTHCAANYEGGWWYSHCEHANLNGRYNLGLTWFHAAQNEWIAVDKSTMRIKTYGPH